MAERVATLAPSRTEAPPSAEEVRRAVAAVRSSPQFTHSGRLGDFLEYVVGRKLSGEVSGAKEYDLAVDVFHRQKSFDPTVDSVVRVEARRLRTKLAQYYADQGRRDRVVISLPRGGYVPEFGRRGAQSPRWPRFVGRRPLTAAAALLACLALVGAYFIWSASGKPGWPHNPEARRLYTQARDLTKKRTADALEASIALYQKAVALDPRYADAYAGMATSYVVLSSQRELPDPARLERARTAIARALELNRNNAEAHAVLGLIHFLYDWDFAAAMTEYERAVAIDPGSAMYRHWYSEVLFFYGRGEEGMAQVLRAHELDPALVSLNSYMGFGFYCSKRYDEAITAFRKALETGSYWKVHRNLGWAYEGKGWYEQAVAEHRLAVEQSGGLPEAQSGLAAALAHAGHRKEALAILERLKSSSPALSPCEVAAVQIALGQKDLAIDNLEWAYHERSTYLLSVVADPRYESVWHDPRVKAIFQGMALPPHVLSQ